MITLQETNDQYTHEIYIDSRWIGHYVCESETEPKLVFIQASQGQITIRDLKLIIKKIDGKSKQSKKDEENEVQ